VEEVDATSADSEFTAALDDEETTKLTISLD